MNKIKSVLFMAGILLVLTLTFSCSSDENNNSETNKCIDDENNNSKINKCTDFVEGTERLHYGKNKPQFCDKRDGEKYVYTVIGNQIWMAENLNYNAKCSLCYNNNPAYCQIYGRLYSWTTALIVCPTGWHLPNDADWDQLYRYADSTSGSESPYESKIAGKYLKAESGWNEALGKTGNGEDKFGFAALPGGIGFDYGNYGTHISAGCYYFRTAGDFGFWASATEYNEYNISIRRIYNYSNYGICAIGYRTDLHSVRCVKD